MYCKKCGNELDENEKFCSQCGSQVEDELGVENKEAIVPAEVPVEKRYSGKGIAGFVLSLVGLLVAALPCGILGVIFSSIAMSKYNPETNKGKGLIIAGLIISILDIIAGVINIATTGNFVSF